jgi:ABC-type glutathione transport system ATPase component
LEELEARLDSIEPFYTLVNGFVSNINDFFRDKYVSYSVRNGVQISSTQKISLNRIMPDQLSSGEQQLLLIFCHVLTTRDNPSIFIIDEPEISLNILWQRRLVTSLQELSSGAQIQFIFASHSMEILSKHRNRVVTLEE